MSDNWYKVSTEARMITLPDIYWRLKELLARRDYSMDEVASLIAYDPALTTRLLHLVNSAYFGFAAQIETVQHAVSILGVREIEELVLATSIADALGDYECEQLDVKQFWLRSVYRAIAARSIANECQLIDSERMFVAGLLSDIGHLILYQSIPVLMQQAQRASIKTGKRLHHAEREIIGFDHARVAASLMKNWKLPESLVSIVEHYLEPNPQDNYALEAAVAHLAALFGDAFADDGVLAELLAQANPAVWTLTGLDAERCIALDPDIGEQLNSVVATLFPKLQRKAS